jgi:3-dehydroquinate synthase
VHIVTNPTVAAFYYQTVADSLAAAGFEPVRIEIPDGEQHKSLATLSSIYDRVLESGSQRQTPLLALGGGVVGDLTGFAAATVLRGVPYVQVPTTLLAQVDSSVGGKTAINHRTGKNLIGSFYQPQLVIVDVDTLASLPRRELLAGLAEVVKYGIILDRELFDLIDSRLDDLLGLEPELTREVIARCCALKAMVVEKDEREADLRAVLNFGHTFGHAIEAVTRYQQFLHGEAVAIGMVAAARLSARLGLCSAEVAPRIETLLRRAGLPTQPPAGLTTNELVAAVYRDKKASQGTVKFVCLEDLGKTRFERITPAEVVRLLSE